MTAAGNTKDIVLRFTGDNRVGPVIQGLQKQLNDLAAKNRKPGLIKLPGTLGEALGAEEERFTKKRHERLKSEQVVRLARLKSGALAEQAIHAQRFAFIAASEERALRLRQFYARKEALLETQRAARMGLLSRATGGMFGIAGGGKALGVLGAAYVGSRLIPQEARSMPSRLLDAASEQIAKWFGIVTEEAKKLAEALREVRTTAIRRGREDAAQALSPFQQLRDQLRPPVVPGQALPENRGLLGSFRAPWAERKKTFRAAAVEAGRSMQELDQTLDPQRIKAEHGRELSSLILRHRAEGGPFGPKMVFYSDYVRMHKQATEIIRDRVAGTVRAMIALNDQQTELENRLRTETTIRGFAASGVALGGDVRAAGGVFRGMLRGAVDKAQDKWGRHVTPWLANVQRNFDLRQETLSPAERLRQELGTLEGERHRLNPDTYARRRRQLVLEGLAAIPQKPQHDLAVTESRFLTRGRDEQHDDLTALRREAKEIAKQELEMLKKVVEAHRDALLVKIK